MSVENLKDALPEYAKDLKLNLGSISRSTVLNEEQLWGTLLASAGGDAKHPGAGRDWRRGGRLSVV